MSSRDILVEGAREFGVELSEIQVELFIEYLDNLQSWNKNINLTAVRNEKEIIVAHFLDSISVVPIIEDNKTLLDIGSGGGFPGIPLKIVRPELRVTLLDSVNKKVSFMKDTVRKLELKDINAIWGRAEDPENNIPRKHFDYIVTRAVGSISDTLELSSPYVSKDGVIILMRGKKGSDEWTMESENIASGYELVDSQEFTLPGSDLARTIIVVKPN